MASNWLTTEPGWRPEVTILARFLTAPATAWPAPVGVALAGAPGAGKSAALARLWQLLEPAAQPRLCTWISARAATLPEAPGKMERLLQRRLGAPRWPITVAPGRWLNVLGDRIRPQQGPAVAPPPRRFLFVDELEHLPGPRLITLLAALAPWQQLGVTLICTLTPERLLATLSAANQELTHHYPGEDPGAWARQQLAKSVDLVLDLDRCREVGPGIRCEPAKDLLPVPERLLHKWLTHFGLGNPRQCRRLALAGILLQQLAESAADGTRQDRPGQDRPGAVLPESLTPDLKAAGLISLVALEYILSRPDPKLRAALLQRAARFRERPYVEETEVDHQVQDPEGRLTDDILALLAQPLPEGRQCWLDLAQALLLPAVIPPGPW